MGLEPYELRGRLALYLRRKLTGEHQAKRLAGLIDCSPRTATNILSGHWPSSRHWAGIARAFGRDVVDAVFTPEIDETVAQLQEEVRALEEQLHEKRARARAATGYLPAAAASLAPVQDWPAGVTGGDNCHPLRPASDPRCSTRALTFVRRDISAAPSEPSRMKELGR
jgi:uncharacterized small protein (DUF1192 family)